LLHLCICQRANHDEIGASARFAIDALDSSYIEHNTGYVTLDADAAAVGGELQFFCHVGAAENKGVVPKRTLHSVAAIAGRPGKGIVAFASKQFVDALATADEIVASQAADRIVTREPIDLVLTRVR
jgi:hypothetical protein